MSKPLWPLRYRPGAETWLRCAVCPKVGQVRDMRETWQSRVWASGSYFIGKQRIDEPAGEITPRRVWVCAKPSPGCASAQAKYCQDAPQGT